MMKKMKKILVILLVAACAVGGVLAYHSMHGEKRESDFAELFGNVEIRQVMLGFRVAGRLEKIFFEEGQMVGEGALLGLLDPDPYQIKRAEANAFLAQAQAQLEKMKSGARTGEVRQAEANRKQIVASLELAKIEHDRIARLYSEKAVSKNDLDKATATRDSLSAQLESTSATLALLREGFRSEDIKSAEAAFELAEAQLRYAENSLADTRLFSPSDGTILTRVAEPGTVLATGQAVYALALKKPVQVRAYLMETQLGDVKVGMSGEIITDSSKNSLSGVVNFIAAEAEFTPKQVQTPDLRTSLVYRVRLLVDDDPSGVLKNGMPVTVRINLKK